MKRSIRLKIVGIGFGMLAIGIMIILVDIWNNPTYAMNPTMLNPIGAVLTLASVCVIGYGAGIPLEGD